MSTELGGQLYAIASENGGWSAWILEENVDKAVPNRSFASFSARGLWRSFSS
jgi:hypothetical protein